MNPISIQDHATQDETLITSQMSLGKWVGTIILVIIPLINLIALLAWAFGREDVLKNFARALLIVYAVTISIAILLGGMGSMLDVLETDSGPEPESNPRSFVEAYSFAQDKITEGLAKDVEVLNVQIIEKEVVGKLKNNSSTKTYSRFAIEFSIYDEDGAIIQTKKTIVDDSIPPGEIYKITDWGIHVDAVSAKVNSISGKDFNDITIEDLEQFNGSANIAL